MLTFDLCTSHCLNEEHKSAAVIQRPITRSLESRAKQLKDKEINHKDMINIIIKKSFSAQLLWG
jgi:hypothetical protein